MRTQAGEGPLVEGCDVGEVGFFEGGGGRGGGESHAGGKMEVLGFIVGGDFVVCLVRMVGEEGGEGEGSRGKGNSSC